MARQSGSSSSDTGDSDSSADSDRRRRHSPKKKSKEKSTSPRPLANTENRRSVRERLQESRRPSDRDRDIDRRYKDGERDKGGRNGDNRRDRDGRYKDDRKDRDGRYEDDRRNRGGRYEDDRRDRREGDKVQNDRRDRSDRYQDDRRDRGGDSRRSVRDRLEPREEERNGGRWSDKDEHEERKENKRDRANDSSPRGKDKNSSKEDSKEGSKEGAKEGTDTAKAVGPTRTGGTYIPPFKLAQMLREIENKEGADYQRMTWDALRKSINGLVNKVNISNIKNILPELFGENMVRGRGLFARSIMKSQMASPTFTAVYAALVAVVNTKFPELGELVLKRVILQFRRAFKRNDKPVCCAASKLVAHLVMQQVAHELLALELITLLLSTPTDDSVEVAIEFVKEVGHTLSEVSPAGLFSVFERFRGILHEGQIDKRVQFMIESLFALRKAGFDGHKGVPSELDLVEADDQITHELSLDDTLAPETGLDVFKVDPQYTEHEQQYQELRKEILGDDNEEEEEEGSDGDDSDDDEEEEEEGEEEEQPVQGGGGDGTMVIQDMTEIDKVNLRRTIYLTIMSSLDFEEAGHKLMKMNIPAGCEVELTTMLIECCSQERTYLRYYGLLGQRFSFINPQYQVEFEAAFEKQYDMIHRLETNKLRNTAKFFAHLLATDALPWTVLRNIVITEDDTTSSSRIFIKILFQELSEAMNLRQLNTRLNDSSMTEYFSGVFPKDIPRNTRFAINFFTSIGLGGLTDNLREYLKNMPKMIMQQKKDVSDSDSDSDTSDSDSDSSSSSDDSSASSSSSDSSSSESSDSSDSDSSESSKEKSPKKKKRKKN